MGYTQISEKFLKAYSQTYTQKLPELLSLASVLLAKRRMLTCHEGKGWGFQAGVLMGILYLYRYPQVQVPVGTGTHRYRYLWVQVLTGTFYSIVSLLYSKKYLYLRYLYLQVQVLFTV